MKSPFHPVYGIPSPFSYIIVHCFNWFHDKLDYNVQSSNGLGIIATYSWS